MCRCIGDNARKVFTEWPITPAQWDMLHNERDGVLVSQWQADKWHLKAGDTLTVIAPLVKKADGSTTWTFKVLAIVGDMAYMTPMAISGAITTISTKPGRWRSRARS